MAGLMTGRMLAEHYAEVLVLDRDREWREIAPRKGVPQSAHIHVLLDKARDTLERLFPGFLDELRAAGSFRADCIGDLAWFHHGVWKKRVYSQIYYHLQSRPLVEWTARRMLQRCENVRLLEKVEVQQPLFSGKGDELIGLSVRRAGESEDLYADLVVDCSGRASKFSEWFRKAGVADPEETSVEINIGYSSRIFRRPADFNGDWKALMIYPKPPQEKRLGYIYHIEPDAEGERWIVSLTGTMGDNPPATDEEFLEFARSLSHPELYRVVRDLEPLTPVQSYRFAENRRVRYEKCKSLPRNFAAVGDSLASFNPIYGQGISIAALAVDVMERELQKGGSWERRYFKRIARKLNDPWLVTTSEDFRYPEAKGKRPPGLKVLNWYMGWIHRLTSVDEDIYKNFFRILHFWKRPFVLFRPDIAGKVLWTAMHSRIRVWMGKAPLFETMRRRTADMLEQPREELWVREIERKKAAKARQDAASAQTGRAGGADKDQSRSAVS